MKAEHNLTSSRQDLVDRLLKNLEEGAGIWRQGWISMGAPKSLVTGKRYRGVNNLCLSLSAMDKGYQDNRWVTYNQMEENGWKFKVDENGNSLGKDAGVRVEFFGLLDKTTNKTLDRAKLLSMSESEVDKYIKENVRSVRKSYVVFNAEVVDGVPELKKLDEIETVKDAEDLISFWNEKECKIKYDADGAYYDVKNDIIHVPKKDQFESSYEYYLTLFHEMSHSTGHESRMNRDLSGDEKKYAIEELRAEIASIFLGQEFNVPYSQAGFDNNASYINYWKEVLTDNPHLLFTAIQDADKITEFVVDKKHENDLKKEPYLYAHEEIHAVDGRIYHTYFYISGLGSVEFLNKFPYPDEKLEELVGLLKEQKAKDKNQGLIKEIPYSELKDKSEEIKKELKELYIKPQEVAKKAIVEKKVLKHGAEALPFLEDAQILREGYQDPRFKKLFNGGEIFGKREQDDRALMSRIALVCDNNNYDQMVRIFKASYRYLGDIEDSYYEKMARRSREIVISHKVVVNKEKNKEISNEKE